MLEIRRTQKARVMSSLETAPSVLGPHLSQRTFRRARHAEHTSIKEDEEALLDAILSEVTAVNSV